jgi:hypothetical protein
VTGALAHMMTHSPPVGPGRLCLSELDSWLPQHGCTALGDSGCKTVPSVERLCEAIRMGRLTRLTAAGKLPDGNPRLTKDGFIALVEHLGHCDSYNAELFSEHALVGESPHFSATVHITIDMKRGEASFDLGGKATVSVMESPNPGPRLPATGYSC